MNLDKIAQCFGTAECQNGKKYQINRYDISQHFWGYFEKMKCFLMFTKVSHSDLNHGH